MSFPTVMVCIEALVRVREDLFSMWIVERFQDVSKNYSDLYRNVSAHVRTHTRTILGAVFFCFTWTQPFTTTDTKPFIVTTLQALKSICALHGAWLHLRVRSRRQLSSTLPPIKLQTNHVQVTSALRLSPCPQHMIPIVVRHKPVEMFVYDKARIP